MIFRHKAVNDLFRFLRHDIIEDGCESRDYGPPETGLSLAILAFSSTLLTSGWKVTWLHFLDREVFQCVRFLRDKKMTTFFRVADLDLILSEEEEAGSQHLMIVRDSRMFPVHQICDRKCRQWFLLNEEVAMDRLIENSSTGMSDSNTEETDEMLGTKPFCFFSWEQNDYNLAVKLLKHKQFRDRIMANLDIENSDSDMEDEKKFDGQQDPDITKVEALLKINFFSPAEVPDTCFRTQQTKQRYPFARL